MAELVLARPGISSPGEKHWSKALPLGIGYIAASARAKGIEVAVVDAKLEGHLTINETVEAIQSHRPAVVGLSALTVEYPRAVEIALRLKRSANSPIVILGGTHANALPAESLGDSCAFDYVFAGEAETTLPLIFKTLKSGATPYSIPGLYMRSENGTVSVSSPARFEENLEDIPFPAWDLFPRVDAYPIMSERGCPFNCVFCSHNMTRRVRSRTVEHTMGEIEWLHKNFAPKEIYFEDETFGLHKELSEELLRKLIKFNHQAGICFKAQTRVDYVSTSMMRLMRNAGFKYVELGVESGDAGVLASSGKGINLEQIEKAITILKEQGIKIWLNLIIGLPGETRHTVRNTIDLAVKINPERLSVAVITAYPGSKVFEWACEQKNGYRLISKDWSQFDKYLSASVELEHLSYRTMRRLQIQTYLETYLRNLRLMDLTKMLWENRSLMLSFGRSIILSASRR